MDTWRDRLNRLTGKTRFGVCRLFIHLTGPEAAPILGILNQAGRDVVAAEGDLEALGEGLVDICQNLLTLQSYWQAATNEGDIFWDEGEAGDYVTELFTDSAQRYLSDPNWEAPTLEANEPLSLPVTQNLVIMITVAWEGEAPDLETDLTDMGALIAGIKALINLHYQKRLRAIQVHFSPAALGDQLTADQVLINFPELIPLGAGFS